MSASAVKKKLRTNEKELISNLKKKTTKFCTDSKRLNLSDFLVFASKIAVIPKSSSAVVHCAGN